MVYTFMILCLYLMLLFIKLVMNQEFCDENYKEKLVTGVMNYYETHFLVFRGFHVWSIEFDKKSLKFLEPKLKKNFIGYDSDDYKYNRYLIGGMVFTKKPNCTPKTLNRCQKMINTTIFFYNNRNERDYYQFYAIFKLLSNGEFGYWNDKPENLPFGLKNKTNQNNIFDYAYILGSAFLPESMELYMISWDRIHILHFKDSELYKYPIDIRFPRYNGTTGGFEFEGNPYFIIENNVTMFHRINNSMKNNCTVWDFFCGKIFSMNVSTSESMNVSTSESITDSPEDKVDNSLIDIILIVTIIIIFALWLLFMMICILSKANGVKNKSQFIMTAEPDSSSVEISTEPTIDSVKGTPIHKHKATKK